MDDDSENSTGTFQCTQCNSNTFILAELGRVGPKDYIGVSCSSCGTTLARVTPDEMSDGFEDQLVK